MVDLLAHAERLKPSLVRWRRQLHQHPELGFEEVQTSAFVKERLKEFGITEWTEMAGTGVVAQLNGPQEGPVILLRADMDALPMQDEKEVEYASKIPGKAHSCGHDAHTTILLGAARLLRERGVPRGTVKLMFQPAEEGLAGAKAMIEAGILRNPDVDAAIALHVQPQVETGKLTVCPGFSTANSDKFDLTIIGEGGHAAHPHHAVDAIAVASQIVSALQQIVSRQTAPLDPAVVTIGKIEGGYARNVIAPSVRMEGTIRTLDRDTRQTIPGFIERIVKGICQGFGADYKLEVHQGYPAVYTDPKLVPLLQEAASIVLGEGCVSVEKPSMGAEDFAYVAERVPSLFFRLGVRNEEKGIVYSHHHPKFDVDENALPIGAAIMAQLALLALESQNIR